MADIHSCSNIHSSSNAEGLRQGLDQASQTCFSTSDFAEAWARSFEGEYRPFGVPVRESGPPRVMYAVQCPGSYGRQFLSLAPRGLYASPGWQGQLRQSTLEGILRCLTGVRTISFVWNVRFDHRDLADGLIASGLNFTRIPTRALSLTPDYERAFTGYNATIRNHVRKARRRGVSVRETVSPESISEYHRVHTRLARQKGRYEFIYPLKLFLELVEIRSIVHLLVAEYQGRVIGGGLFFRDGNSTLYWHGASDREYSYLYPSCAVLDEAIRWACESGSSYFNFGASEGLTTIDRFKSFWGARTELNWQFAWTNPFWAYLSKSKRRLCTSNAR
jgi:Acetyltransferase (GNAT) domain